MIAISLHKQLIFTMLSVPLYWIGQFYILLIPNFKQPQTGQTSSCRVVLFLCWIKAIFVKVAVELGIYAVESMYVHCVGLVFGLVKGREWGWGEKCCCLRITLNTDD